MCYNITCSKRTRKIGMGVDMRKLGRILIVSLMVSSLVVTPVMAEPPADGTQNEEQVIDKPIDKPGDEVTTDDPVTEKPEAEKPATEKPAADAVTGILVDGLQKEKQAAELELKSMEVQLAEMMTGINELEMNLVNTGEGIIKTTKQLEKAQEKEKKQYQDMKRHIKAIYEYGNMAMLDGIFKSGSIAEFLRRAEYVQSLHSYDRKLLKKYVKTKEKTSDLKEKLEADMKNLEEMQVQYEESKKALDEMLLEKRTEVANIDLKLFEIAMGIEQGEGTGLDYIAPEDLAGGQAIVEAAKAFIGVPYVWGGASKSGIDCSGLVLMAHKAIGVDLAHYSGIQGSGGKAIPSMALAL